MRKNQRSLGVIGGFVFLNLIVPVVQAQESATATESVSFTFSPTLINGIEKASAGDALLPIDLTPDQYKDIGCSEKISLESSAFYTPSYTAVQNCSESALQTKLLMTNRDLVIKHELETQRYAYQAIAQRGLELLYAKSPKLKAVIESAPGYAVFEIKNYNAVLYVAGYGKGMIFDHVKDTQSYIYTVRSGTGFGIGYQEVYAIMIFKKHAALVQFNAGSSVGGDIGAAATLGTWSQQMSFNPYIDTYLINEEGFNIQANWGGTLYFATPGLND